jgi:hypothetical protein
MLQVLRELYCCAFQRGSSIPVPDLINSLLAVPCPQQGSPKVTQHRIRQQLSPIDSGARWSHLGPNPHCGTALLLFQWQHWRTDT